MIDPSSSIRIQADLGPRSYPIVISSVGEGGFGQFAREALDATWSGAGCMHGVVITDANVEAIAGGFESALAGVGISVERIAVPAGESSKSLDRVSSIYDRLIENRADRHHAVFAIGGGVVGDLAGFVAATYARGLPLVMVPTTLLSQVDSSVGGKTGVNHPLAKNIIGAFHQPVGVWIDTSNLATLPVRELRSGIAEVIKYGIIWNQDLFDDLEANADRILNLESESLVRIVAESCRIKAAVVAGDEFEQTGLRAVLNFGHTVAHAIEAVAGYSGLYTHGEAVAVGMIAETTLAERLGWVGAEITDRVTQLVERFGLPTRAPGLDQRALVEAMSRDKKNRAGRIRFVLPRRIGVVEMCDAATNTDILEMIKLITFSE